MSTSDNLGLFITNDTSITFQEWFYAISGTDGSNMTILDETVGDISNKLSGVLNGEYDFLSILIVDELPDEGEEKTVYLVPKSNNGTGYNKYIYVADSDGEYIWDTFGSASTVVVTELPETGEEDVEYILQVDEGEYVYYKYISGAYYAIGGNAYTKEEVDALLEELKTEIQESIDKTNSAITELEESLVAKIEALQESLTEVSNASVVNIVSNEDGSVTVTYGDGTTETVVTKAPDASQSSATIDRITDASIVCVYGESCNIEYTFTALDSSGDVVGSGTATWYVNNIAKATSTAVQGDNSFDIGNYLSSGSNTVKLSISVDVGDYDLTTVTKTWTVNAVNMYLTWSYDDTTINTDDSLTLYWTPYGSGIEKTAYLYIDGEEVMTSTTTRSGVQQSGTIDISGYEHGSHTAEMYLVATIDDVTLQSDSVVHEIIIVDEDSTVPIISVNLTTTTMTQYNTLQIPVLIYDPSSATTDATLAVNGEDVAEWTDIDRTIHYWNYTPSEYGEMVLSITCGETVWSTTITVEELDIDNAEVSGYAFKLKASDLASNNALEAWDSNGYTLSFSDNFDWENGGIQTEEDDDGNIRQYICVKAGTTMTIDYELFGGNDPKSLGRTFKIIFKVVNSRDYDAVWLNCYNSSSEGGLVMGANEATVNGSNSSTYVEYTEDTYIEYEFDIRARSVQPYLQTFIDGVLSTTVLYSDSEDFNQTDAQNIVIGSDDCDVYIYLVKVYETYLTLESHMENFIADAPNATEMADRYNRNDVLNDDGDISYSKLAAQCPDLRIHLWDIPYMTTGKKDYVSGCSYKQIYHNDDTDYNRHQLTAEGVTINIQGTSSVDYRASGANTDGDFSTCSSFVDGDGNDLLETGYSMEDDSMPVTYFNTKVNIASCENVNNMCLAEWYNTYQPYQTLYAEKIEEEGAYSSRDTMELHMGVQFISDQSGDLFDYDGDYHMYAICNMGNSKKNIEVFHDTSNLEECCVEVLDNNSTYCMMTDDSFDLDALQSEDYFEFRYSADYADSNTYTDDELSAAKSAQEQAFIDFVLWMAESNPAAYTDEELDEEVTFGSYTFTGSGRGDDVLAGLTISEYAGTYTTDSYEYRMAKMLSECEDHLIMDSVVYHYVFVEEHAMVDNVCKNTFWSTEDLQHWQLTKNYDNDTADGINNTGLLTIPFGSEGLDTLDDGYVFNGKDSVWWQFVYGLYDARQLMWQNRENAGAWDHEAYLEFVSEQQDLIPERVWNQDYWYKYLRLYEESSVSTYLEMLESGKKSHQRTGFVTNNMYYMAGQYMGTTCTSQSITLRGYTPSSWSGVEPASQVQVSLYNKGYIVVQVGSIYKRQKADKGTMYTIEFTDSGDMNDTVINIHGANLVKEIGDISCLYVGRCDFSAATRVRSIQIGSTEEGYSNGNLTSLSFGTNTMLEELYIQNCPNAAIALDLTGCQALQTIDTTGSGFTGITFATGGRLEVAYLNGLVTLTMLNLQYLTDDYFTLESYESLSGLRVEGCDGIDTLALVEKATNLSRVRLVDIDWTLYSTDVLNALLELSGYDSTSLNTAQSVLTGTVTMECEIRASELEDYEAAWDELTIVYDSQDLIQNYVATYVNLDGTELYSCYVDAGAYPPDPVEEGYIEAPTMETDAQYIYTYSGWDNLTAMRGDRTITATYDTETRTYTINWYAVSGDSTPLYTLEDVEYGDEVSYGGDTPTRAYSSGMYSLWTGWDKSTGYVTGDTDVYGTWQRAAIPAEGTELSDMTIAEIYAVCEEGEADTYFVDKDYFEFEMGSDFDFDNVESETLLEDTFFDGSTAYNTGYYLFTEDAPNWVLAVDYEFMYQSTSGATLVSGGYVEDGAYGFRLKYVGTGYTGYGKVEWGSTVTSLNYGCNRNIIVLRHLAGSSSLTLYSFNASGTTTYDDNLTATTVTRTTTVESDEPLTFGAVYVSSEDAYADYASGMIHWAKIWWDDIGAAACEKLASWPHETMRMEYIGADRYKLASSSVYYANASFISNAPLALLHNMNSSSTNSGGWDESLMRTFLNERFYAGLSQLMQSAIKQVKIKASAGSASEDITTSTDYIYLPAYNEMGGGSSYEPYVSEGDAISWFTANMYRAKVPGIVQYDDNIISSGTTDPSGLSAYASDLVDGSVWWNGSYRYVYISPDTLAKHSRFGYLNIDDSSFVTAEDGGLWARSQRWWLRSPISTSTNTFWWISESGALGSYYIASYTYGVVPGFSI